MNLQGDCFSCRPPVTEDSHAENQALYQIESISVLELWEAVCTADSADTAVCQKMLEGRPRDCLKWRSRKGDHINVM